jgi:hypothetical protein
VSNLRPIAFVVFVVALVSCGGSTPSSNASHPAQPAPNGQFVSGDIDSLPLLPRMKSLGPPANVNNVTTESFRLTGYEPRDAVVTYGRLLTGWDNRIRPHAVGSSYRAMWTHAGSNVLVTAIPDPTLNQGNRAGLEMTLQLFPPGVTPPTAAVGQ